MENSKETYEFNGLLQDLPKEKSPEGIEFFLYEGHWYPSFILHGIIDFQKKFKACNDDLILVTFPKSGTTWLKALTFSIANRANIPIGENPLLKTNPQDLIPFVENEVYGVNPIHKLEDMPFPRILSTHVPFSALPCSIKDSNCRVVYLCRNPMDMLISAFHFVPIYLNKKIPDEDLSVMLDENYELFCRGVSGYGPFWDHMLGYWNESQKEPQRVLFLKYEDLKEDVVGNVKMLANFMGYPFSADEEERGVIEEISRLCSFDHLKSLEVNKANQTNAGVPNKAFFRKGNVGDWTNYFSPDKIEGMAKLLDEKFGDCGLNFKK